MSATLSFTPARLIASGEYKQAPLSYRNTNRRKDRRIDPSVGRPRWVKMNAGWSNRVLPSVAPAPEWSPRHMFANPQTRDAVAFDGLSREAPFRLLLRSRRRAEVW